MMNQALLDHFEEQARFCDALGAPFTARLIEAMARDLVAGGPVAELVGQWSGPPRADAVSLRLAGALHAAALSRRDPVLAAAYPARSPKWNIGVVWEAARAFIDRERDWVSEFIRSAPQTNETNRSIALLLGFLDLAARFDLPIDLLEIGASAGLNLFWDRFAYRAGVWTWGGASDVLIETTWNGPPPRLGARPRIRTRLGCDLNPPDLRNPAERLRLRAYIWADQTDRLARFDAAVAVALAGNVRVERMDAADWLERRLTRRATDALTIVYHSVFIQYLPKETRERIKAALDHAGEATTVPLAWLRLEPEAALGGPRDSAHFLVDLVIWPGGERRTLARTDGHVRRVEVMGCST
jgi:hypothetical protein